MVYPLDSRFRRRWFCGECKLRELGLPAGAGVTAAGVTLDNETINAAVAALHGFDVDTNVDTDNPAPTSMHPTANTPAYPTRQAAPGPERPGPERKKGQPAVAPAPTRAQQLTIMPVPREWVGVRGATAFGILAAFGGLVLGSNQLVNGNTLAGVVITCAGFLLGAWGWCLSKFETRAVAAFLAVALALVGLGMFTDHLGLAWLAGLVSVVLGAVTVWELFRRASVSRALVFLSAGLANAVGEGKKPEPWSKITPRWFRANRHTGLPTKWALPLGLPTDPRSLLVLEHEASAFAGVPVKITIGPKAKYAYLTARAAGDPLAPLHTAPVPIDAEVARVAATLSANVGEARIHELRYGAESGEFERLEFSWPDEKNARLALTGVQNSVIRTVKAAVKATTTGGSLHNYHLSAAWDLPNNRVVIEPVKPMPSLIKHPPREDVESPIATFGVRRSGEVCRWDLTSTAAHVAIGGVTGGGKTTIFLSLLTELPLSAEVVSIDPKYVSLKGIEFLPQARGRKASKSPQAMANTLEDVYEEMMRRVEGMDRDEIHPEDLHHLVLVVDEGETMVDILNDSWRDPEVKEAYAARRGWAKPPQGSAHPVVGRIARIVQLGREAKVHLLLASQQFGAAWLGTNARDQFAVRIGKSNMSAIASKMLFDSPYAAVSGLEAGPGRAWVQLGVGQAVEQAQIYYTPKLDRNRATETDREILAGLNIELPEAMARATGAEDSPAEAPAAEWQAAARGHLRAVPTSDAPSVDAEPETPAADSALVPDVDDIAVSDLEEGAQIVVDDEDGEPAVALVESIDPDDADDDNLVVSWVIEETGEVGTLSVPTDETVPVVAA